jgi:hypothetical protein
MTASTRVILCEGYHDRAFLAGLFEDHLGLEQLRVDLNGRSITQGQFGYRSRTGSLIIVVPCGGVSKIFPAARSRLSTLPTEPLEMVVLCNDDDRCLTRSECQARATDRRQQLQQHIEQLQEDNRSAPFTVAIESLTWACDSKVAYIPSSQCLERLVVGALAETYATRGQSASDWLASRPERPSEGEPKAHMWTHMAGWFAGHGCDSFLRQLWSDPQLATAFRRLLDLDWPVIERLVA